MINEDLLTVILRDELPCQEALKVKIVVMALKYNTKGPLVVNKAGTYYEVY